MVAGGRVGPTNVRLVKPLTYMNLSGKVLVPYLRRPFWSPATDLLVVVDDVALPVGRYRLRARGSAGGHNGLRSVTAALGTPDYYRVRFGIGRPPGRMDPAVYVLHDFSAAERKDLPFFIDRAADATEALIANGLDAAQNAYHTELPG